MKTAMTVTYEVGEGLYINVTNYCTNHCFFCIRKNGEGAYGSDSLWLEREPTEEEILDSVFSRDLSKYKELVFCGYGEPSVRLGVCRSVALKVKAVAPHLSVRINTNGHSDLILERNTAPEYRDAFDTVSISLNAPTAEKYAEICHPVYKLSALDAVIEFARNVKEYVHSTVFTVVGDFLTEKEISECRSIADSVGIPLRVREYIG